MLGVFRQGWGGVTEDGGMEGCATVNNRIMKGGQERREREIEGGRRGGGGERGYGSLLRN